MHSPSNPAGIEVSAEEIAAISAIYANGLTVQACERACALGPLAGWRGTAALILAGRIAHHVYAPKLGYLLHARAWRTDRSNAAAAYFRSLAILHRRGPWPAWKFLRALPDFPHATLTERADLLSARAEVLCQFRDFERATAFLDEAQALEPQNPWCWVIRAMLLRAQDCYPEALEANRRARAIKQWFRPAVQTEAELLQMLGRDDEALTLLRDACRNLESAALTSQLATLESELGLHAEALASWERVPGLAPLMEPMLKNWWNGRLSDSHYALGDTARAADAAARAGTPFFERMAARLSEPPSDIRRVLLPVPFVRQHHMTCAPATISAISRFLQQPIDHLHLAAVVCYDGTPDHVGRHWLEENGWTVREFRTTWETAVTLLDRGIPFAVATVETRSAHLQALIGYDNLRSTLLIRDPSHRTHGEVVAESFLERYASSGPQAMVLLPREQADRLADIALPDVELYDLRYQLQRALHRYDRDEAQRHCETMEAAAPTHRLTIECRRTLALHDASQRRWLTASEELLVQFPKDGNLLLGKLAALRDLTRRAEYRDFLRQLAIAPDAEPIFWREWAEELGQDAREYVPAHRLLLRTLRFCPLDADALCALAGLLWNRREFAEAAELYRIAACLGDKSELFSRFYFLTARHLRFTETALALFRGRLEKFGGQSARPAQFLFWALSVLDRGPEAFEMLEAALLRRPDDGELLLFSADAFARSGDPGRAEALLLRAETRSSRTAWLRTAAALADYRCALPEALALWSQVLEAQPLAIDARQTVTRLLAETQGRAAAREQLRDACERFSHYVPLCRLAVEWARADGAAAVEPLLVELLRANPDDAWACREFSLILAEQQKFEEALRHTVLAEEMEPHEPATHGVRAQVLRMAGRLEEAREACRTALRFSIDYAQAMNELLASSDTFEEKRDSIAFLRGELVRQVVFGESLLVYRDLAFTVLEPEELLAGLREALEARPDLWHAWSAVILQLIDMRQGDEALSLAQQAVERFPLQPAVWLDLSKVHRARSESEEEIRPLRRALLLQPAWGEASRNLASAFQRLEQYDDAVRALEHAIAAAPLDPVNHGALANLLWRLERKSEAIDRLEHALRLEPRYDSAWEALHAWSNELGTPERSLALAQQLLALRPGEVRSWFLLAQCLPESDVDERLKALQKATDLDPRFVEGWDMRAVILAEAGRFEEALAACQPAAWKEAPFPLQGRRAWVEANRGNLRVAIDSMREIVRRWPDYYWGWNLLCDWWSHTGEHDQARSAARQMARLAPRSALPLGSIASVQIRLGDKKEARETLLRALAIEPAYRYAASTLFQLQLESRDFAGAEQTLAHMQVHLPGAPALSAEAQLGARESRTNRGVVALRQLCFVPESETASLLAAARAFPSADKSNGAEFVFSQCLTQPGVNPEVGACWVQCWTARGDWGERERLYKLDPSTPIGRRARVAYIEACGDQGDPKFLRGLLNRERASLHADPVTWGVLGFAYVRRGQNRDAISWMADWRLRQEVQPWMLSNLAVALREEKRASEALEVSRRALQLPADHTTSNHQLWVACEAACAGDPVAAARLLGEHHNAEISPFFQAVHAVASAVVEVHNAASPQKLQVYENQLRTLQHSRFSESFTDKALSDIYTRGVREMARAAGTKPSRKAKRLPRPAPPPSEMSPLLGRVGWIALVLMLSGALRTCSEPIRPPSVSPIPKTFANPRGDSRMPERPSDFSIDDAFKHRNSEFLPNPFPESTAQPPKR